MFHRELKGLEIPAYLLDCATRLHTWNAYIPKVIRTKPEILQQFAGQYLIRIYYDERVNLVPKMVNPEEFFEMNRRALQQYILPYLGHVWVDDLVAEFSVLNLDKIVDTLIDIPARPKEQFHLFHDNHVVLKFWVMQEPVLRDNRFFVLYLMPASEETYALLRQWRS